MRFICSAVTIKSLLSSSFFFLNNNSNNNNLERKDSYLDFSLLSLLLLLFFLFLPFLILSSIDDSITRISRRSDNNIYIIFLFFLVSFNFSISMKICYFQTEIPLCYRVLEIASYIQSVQSVYSKDHVAMSINRKDCKFPTCAAI